jgi:hypothetical protein
MLSARLASRVRYARRTGIAVGDGGAHPLHVAGLRVFGAGRAAATEGPRYVNGTIVNNSGYEI